ncbi:MAG TPA: alpha/beta hydrolase [Holophagaceae bacterium]|nr:alpha/beta hydrolase [Holophagaceae bacterium]
MDPRLDQSWRAVPVPWQRRWGRRLAYLILLGAVAMIAGLVYEPFTEAMQLRNSPPPGRVVQADGLDMHMQVAGPPSKPVVVLFNAWGMPSSSWSRVMSQVSQSALVVRWDPPGYAWSALGNSASDATSQAERIHAAMNAYEVTGPYLLVGSGLGAVEARAFAARYPDEVGGMVLLDPWHQPLMADAAPRIDDLERQATERRFSWHRLRAWWNKEPDPEFDLPSQDETVLLASLRTVKMAQAKARELQALPRSFGEIQALQSLGQKPLIVLTSASLDKDGSDGPWAQGSQAGRLQMDELFSKMSTEGKHQVIAGATPVSLICRQDLADQVVLVIRSCMGR